MTELYYLPLFSDSDLLAYYRLSDVYDSSPGGHTLTNTGSVAFNAAKFGNGADFGSSNSGKSLSKGSSLNWTATNVTLGLWAKISTAPSSGVFYLIAKLQRASDDTMIYLGYYNNSGTKEVRATRLVRGVAQNNAIYNYDLGTSDFNHLVARYDGTYIKLFVNGAEVASTSSSSSSGTAALKDGFSLARNMADNGTLASVDQYYFSGLIDDCFVFNRSLTETQISTIYNTAAFIPKILIL